MINVVALEGYVEEAMSITTLRTSSQALEGGVMEQLRTYGLRAKVTDPLINTCFLTYSSPEIPLSLTYNTLAAVAVAVAVAVSNPQHLSIPQ
ncbi:hypothetical protein QVD17_04755 [Tagetes erecta]|uniref:Uncharacterized protein n=1 Tax=Tagetes erecta TaxID=13708 RepID=A0AAD8LID6_TARER|nr:hypothetical protein QVD17_04755 [Tagetes erecta]